MRQIGQQAGGVAKGVVRQIVQEPVEIAKTAAEQVAGPEIIGGQQARQQTPQPPSPPSPEGRLKLRILEAHRRELADEITRRRHERLKQVEEQEVMEQRKVEEKRKKEELKKETIFQKGLRLITGRLRRRVETRLPKAA